MNPFLILPFLFQTNVSNTYIQFDSQDEYIPKNHIVHIELDACVDTNTSEFFYNGNKLDIHEETFDIQISKEGLNTISFSLKDTEGTELEQGEQVYVVDSTNPIIKTSVEDVWIDSRLIINEDVDLRIEIEDQSDTKKQVFVDGKEVDYRDSIQIHPSNTHVQIKAIDQAGNDAQKDIDIIVLSNRVPTLSVANGSYTTQHVEQQIADDWKPYYKVIFEKDNQEISKDDWCKTPGAYQVHFIPIYAYLPTYTYAFTYSNTPPWLQIQSERTKSNQPIQVYFSSSDAYVKERYIRIFDGQSYQIQPWAASITLEGLQDAERSYSIEGVIIDAFGRKVIEKKEVTIDRTLPSMELLVNQQVVDPQSILSFMQIPSVHTMISKPCTMQIEYTRNGQTVYYPSIDVALRSIQPGERLKTVFTLIDDVQNVRIYSYTWEKEAPQTTPTKKTYPKVKVDSYNVTHQLETRSWTMNENHEIKMEKVTKDTLAPTVFVTRKKGNRIRICILDNQFQNTSKFQSVWINGKRVSLKKVKKDALGNPYIEVVLKHKKTKVKVLASDLYGNSTLYQKTFQKDVKMKKPIPYWEKIRRQLVQMFHG